MVVAWFVLGVVLVAIELHNAAFYALFVAIGAFVAAIVAGIAPDAIVLQVVVALAVSAVGIGALRPLLAKAVHRRTSGERIARGVHGGLVGELAVTLDDVGGLQKPGHVWLAGERWLARSHDGSLIEEDVTVRVLEVQGTTLIVMRSPIDTFPPSASPF